MRDWKAAAPVWWHDLGGDFRHGLRALARSRGTTAVALLTLTLGIGGNAAIFSVVDAVLLRPLPFRAPDRLVAFWGSAPEKGLPVVHYPDGLYAYFRVRSHVLDPVAAYTGAGFTLTGAAGSERLNGTIVTADFFRTLGRLPIIGRTFLPEEEARGRNHVVVLSHGLWVRRFGGNPQIVGKAVTLDDAPTTVVGVMPQDFDFPRRTDLWEPIATDPQSLDCWCYSTIGRLAPGRTPHDAARDIALLTDAFWRDREPGGKKAPDPESEPESRVVAASLASTLVGGIRTPLLVLFGAVGLVLLIACANVANLLLARATTRSRETAVRTCLGAGPWRVARQLLLESLLLGLGGGLLGLACASSGIRAIERLVAELVSPVEPIALDLPVLGFTAVVMFASVALFGLAPAIRGARVDLQATLKDGGRATRSPVRHLNDAFVVVQLSLSLVLLVGAGLLLRSLGNLVAVDPGFRADGVLVGRTVLPPLGYGDPARVRAFYDELARRVRGLPGVVSAGFSSSAPFSAGDNGQNFTIRGASPDRASPPWWPRSAR